VCDGFLVGFLVGFGVDGAAGGGGGATVAVGSLLGWTVAVGVLVGVGVFWVGAAAAGANAVVSPEPAALWGHQATRQAARPSNAATAMRVTVVPVLLTTSSWAPATADGCTSLACEGTPLPSAGQKIQRTMG
jgi:hypothetical protein